ncbi:MAG: DMP19 family protein [Paludibacter sp.]
MVVRSLTQQEVEEEPLRLWNSFKDLLATDDYADLDEIQRIAYLCFWYDSEVLRGGHLGYFVNQRLDLLNETVKALSTLGAASQSSLLKGASDKLSVTSKAASESVEEYLERAIEGDFDEFDDGYYVCHPNITDLLAWYFEQNRKHFVRIE